MKTYLLVAEMIALSLIMLASSAQAELVLHKTAFWQTMYEKNQVLIMTAAEPNLSKACEDYKNKVTPNGNQSNFGKEDIEILRRVAKDVWQPNYVNTKFVVDVQKSTSALRQSIEAANVGLKNAQPDQSLPEYTANLAELSLSLESQSKGSLVTNRSSLTKISEGLGLKALPFKILGGGEGLTIQFEGLDTACDLLSGNASLEFESVGQVIISEEDQKNLTAFYEPASGLVKDVFGKRKAPSVRAAVVGLKVGSLVDQLHRQNKDITANQVANFVERFFDDKFNPNSHWSFGSDGLFSSLSVPFRSMNAAVHISVVGGK